MNTIEIEIGGKLRTFRFGLGFLGEILDYLDTDVGGLGQLILKNPFKTIPAILYIGHKNELELTGLTVDFTLNSVYEWLEAMENTYANPEVEKVLEFLLASMRRNVPGLQEAFEEEEKPKKK